MEKYKNNVARSLLYLLIAGGLLFFVSAFFQWFINRSICPYFNMDSISFLESIGIVSIFGVILFAIKFGFFNHIDINLDSIQQYSNDPKNHSSNQSKTADRVSKMDKNQKEELKIAISKYFGFEDHLK